jgi:hypothetical protein
MILKDNEFFILETNTIPGMTATSLFPQSAQAAGMSFGDAAGPADRTGDGRPASSNDAGVRSAKKIKSPETSVDADRSTHAWLVWGHPLVQR